MSIELRITEILNRELKGNWPLADHLARVLVTELGLDEELSRSAFPEEAGKRRRYVTPWEPRARAVGAELTIQEES